MLFLAGAVDAGVGGDVEGDVGVLPGPSVGSVLERKHEIEGNGQMILILR